MVLHLIRPARHFERRPVDTAPWSFERTHGQVIELSGQGGFCTFVLWILDSSSTSRGWGAGRLGWKSLQAPFCS